MPTIAQLQAEINGMVKERIQERVADSKNFMDVNVAARHMDRDATKRLKLNEDNPGIGLEHDEGDHRVMGGYYKNSFNKPSVYGLVGYTPLHINDNLKMGVVGGGVTGYIKPVTPAAGLIGTYQNGDTGVNLTLVPTVKVGDTKAYGFAGVQLRHRFK